jgi:hypothetical protein
MQWKRAGTESGEEGGFRELDEMGWWAGQPEMRKYARIDMSNHILDLNKVSLGHVIIRHIGPCY